MFRRETPNQIQRKDHEMNAVINQEGRTDGQARAAQNEITPDVNIFETPDGYVLQAEMPGVNKSGLEITLDGNELAIVGRRAPDDSKVQALYRESTAADYRRVFQLDPAIDTARIDAKIEQGVLTLQLPKSERVKPRKISVND
jgi:HSP20 family protein